jgi:flagellar basal body rod protein FlgB
MIERLFGTGSVTNQLRGGLSEASATHKAIATRVAGALKQSTTSDFANQLEGKLGNEAESLEQDMASLADTQLRFEATARLLQKAYSDLRTAARANG